MAHRAGCSAISAIFLLVFSASVIAFRTGDRNIKPIDKSDWVDMGDMFSFDPVSGTNRDSKLKDTVDTVITKAKEKKAELSDINEKTTDPPDLEALCTSKCDEISFRLNKCEAKIMTLNNPESTDRCSKMSYLFVRRLMIALSKKFAPTKNTNQIIRLTINSDEIFFDLPDDLSNQSDCDYIANLNSLSDQLLSSIVTYSDEVDKPFLLQCVSTGLAILLVLWYTIKMSSRTRIYLLICLFVLVTLVWEYFLMIQEEMASFAEKSDRLRAKCESQSDQSWTNQLKSWLPQLTMRKDDDCLQYYIATRVGPFLAVNPIKVFPRLFHSTFLYGLKLTADSIGESTTLFFGHFPVLYFPFFLIATFTLLIFLIKYLCKYTIGPGRRQPPIVILNDGSQASVHSIPKIRSPNKPSMKQLPKNITVKQLLARCGSTGNLRELSI